MHIFKKITQIGLSLLLSMLLAIPCHAESTGWGLGYSVPGQQPQGMASRESLLEYDAYYVGDSGEKVIYLTFDAGYENGYMETILDVLKNTKVPAAFFLVGTYIRDNPKQVERMLEEGHIVANHTMNHPDMSVISELSSFKNELSQAELLYKELTQQDMPKYYRPPRGIYSTDNLEMAKELGYKTIFWSLAYVDWYVNKQPSHEEAFAKLIPRAHSGMVLLLHTTSKTNAEILEELICKYKELGYEFKTLDSLTA